MIGIRAVGVIPYVESAATGSDFFFSYHSFKQKPLPPHHSRSSCLLSDVINGSLFLLGHRQIKVFLSDK